jgi:uncharacterized oxidoreductase
MKTTRNTILITGGSAGIGFEIAKLFSKQGNHVIITGRDRERLRKAAEQLEYVTAIACDISNEGDMDELVQRIKAEFPNLNMLINNAGKAKKYDLLEEGIDAYWIAKDEMQTNFFSVVRLTEKLLPILRNQPEAAIVNVSSIVAIVPGSLVTYSASKAALHSYTQALRLQLEDVSAVKVFELMPPLVNTELSKEIGGANGIPPSVVAERLFEAMGRDEYEIHVGQTADLYKLFLSSPAAALQRLNGQRKLVEHEK